MSQIYTCEICGYEWNNQYEGTQAIIEISDLVANKESSNSSFVFKMSIHLCDDCLGKYGFKVSNSINTVVIRKEDPVFIRQKEVESNIRTNIKSILATSIKTVPKNSIVEDITKDIPF